MKFEEPIMGFINYKEKDYPFMYENNILKLFPPSIKAWNEEKIGILEMFNKWTNSITNNEWIPDMYLNGKTQDNYDIAFYVLNDPSNINGFISFQVIYCIKYDSKNINCDNINGIEVEGRELDYFYVPSKVFKYNLVMNENNVISLDSININKCKEELIGEYEYKNIKVKILSSIKISLENNSNSPIQSKSKFKFIFSEPKNLEYAIDVYYHCKLFLYYVCNRKIYK